MTENENVWKKCEIAVVYMLNAGKGAALSNHKIQQTNKKHFLNTKKMGLKIGTQEILGAYYTAESRQKNEEIKNVWIENAEAKQYSVQPQMTLPHIFLSFFGFFTTSLESIKHGWNGWSPVVLLSFYL